MKKYCYILFALVMFLIVLPSSALTVNQNVTGFLLESNKNVAYIYSSEGKIDQNVIDFFVSLDFNVTLINEKTFPVDLEKYKFVYFGDERLRRLNKIDLTNITSIVANHYNTHEFGLSDRDGASQMSSSSPLAVIKSQQRLVVYTRAFERARVGVPYYFLDNNNIADSLETVAFTDITSSGRNFGSVIAYAMPGDFLENGKVAKKNICFFGIIKSNFWTQNAINLFEDCIDFVSS